MASVNTFGYNKMRSSIMYKGRLTEKPIKESYTIAELVSLDVRLKFN
jgi:hypothetical protein